MFRRITDVLFFSIATVLLSPLMFEAGVYALTRGKHRPVVPAPAGVDACRGPQRPNAVRWQ
jgi:hypothetical protein